MMRGRILRRIAACFAAACILVQGYAADAQETEGKAQLPQTEAQSTQTEAQETKAPVAKKIAVLTYSFSSEYWGYVAQGCQAYGKGDSTVDITVEGPSSSIASDEQITMLKSDLQSGRYDGYVIAAIDRAQVEEVLKDVKVPVVAIDSPFEADCVIGGIGTNNEAAAIAGAKKAVDMAKNIGWESVECVMIGGRSDDSNNENRKIGFSEGIKDAGGVWLDQVYDTDKSNESAQDAMRKIMEDHPEGIAIVACYNDNLAEAALAAAAGNSAYENTVFLGFDGIGSMCERLMTDESYAHMVTVAQNPYEMGFRAVEMISHYLSSQEDSEASQGDGAVDSGRQADSAGEDDKDTDDAGGDDKDADDAGEDDKDAGDTGGDDKSESADSESSGIDFLDSGYSVITQANAQERMVQIQSHLS